jgi:prolyl-tRNA synthetase
VHTPAATTIAEVTRAVGVVAGATLKAFPVVADGRGLILVLVRGDHRVNEIKLANALGTTFRAAHDDEVRERIGPPGFIGPVGADVPVLLDDAVDHGGYVVGANEPDHHLRGVEPGRDFPFERADVRTVEAGDTVGGHPITIERAIEIGNIFKLGTRYSEPLDARFLDEHGKEQSIWMGSYGIGPARVAAAAVEQFADEQGISWPKALAPWDVEVVALGKPGSQELAAAQALYDELLAVGLDVLLDDRDAGPGNKFADAELLGCPLRLTVGRRSLEAGAAEAQVRRGRRDVEGGVPLTGSAEKVLELWRTLP